jgi:hypothetical protein
VEHLLQKLLVTLIFWWLLVEVVQTPDESTEHGMAVVVLAV